LFSYVVVAQLLRGLVYADQMHREHAANKSMLALTRMTRELRALIEQGDWAEFEAAEARAWDAVDHLQREDIALAAIGLSLARAEYGMARKDPALACEGVELVRSNGANLPPAEAREYELQALALAALTLRPEAPDDGCLDHAEQALSPADRPQPQTVTSAMLVAAACHLALVRRAMGLHDAADRAALRAIELSSTPDLVEVYAHASKAAVDAAMHRIEEQDGAAAVEWFDRAEQVVADSQHPACRLRHAEVLLARDNVLPGDPLLGGADRRRRSELALKRLHGVKGPLARLLAARACGNLGRVCSEEGRYADAAGHLVDALERLAPLTERDAIRMRVQLLLECGRARRMAQDPGALQDFERALDEASAAVDAETRALAVMAVHELRPMLSALGMHAHLADVLGRARSAAESLPAGRARPANAKVEMLTADMEYFAGRAEDARRRLATLLARLETDPDESARRTRFLVLTRLASDAFTSRNFARAVEWYERALAMGALPGSPLEAERSDAEWILATAKAQLGLIDEARVILRRAFERGRASGEPLGRFASAKCAFSLAEHAVTTRERQDWLESALALARGCHMAEGDRLAELIEARRRELEGGG